MLKYIYPTHWVAPLQPAHESAGTNAMGGVFFGASPGAKRLRRGDWRIIPVGKHIATIDYTLEV